MDIKKTEKTIKTVNIYQSTYDTIIANKKDYQISVFIDLAVKHYVKTMNDSSEINQILTQITDIRDAVRTSLGLSCEVLKQAGILNGNGEINFLKKN